MKNRWINWFKTLLYLQGDQEIRARFSNKKNIKAAIKYKEIWRVFSKFSLVFKNVYGIKKIPVKGCSRCPTKVPGRNPFCPRKKIQKSQTISTVSESPWNLAYNGFWIKKIGSQDQKLWPKNQKKCPFLKSPNFSTKKLQIGLSWSNLNGFSYFFF